MADFITCTTNSFTFETLLRALFAQADGFGYFRVVTKTAAEEAPITCDTNDDFVELFNQALELCDDGFPALRICVTVFLDTSALSNADECDMYKSLDLMTRMTFVYTTEGDVALNLASIV